MEKAYRYSILWLGWVLATAYLIPNHYAPWVTFHQEMLAGMAFLPLMLLSLFEWNKRKGFSIFEIASFVVMVPLIQFASGEIIFFSDAFVATLYLLGFASTLLFGSGFVAKVESGRSLDDLIPLFVMFVFSGVVSVFMQVHQWLDLRLLSVFIVDLKIGARPYANLAQPNNLATLLLLGQVSLVYLYESRKIGVAAATILASVLSLGLALTQSRTALVALTLVASIWALCARRINAKASNRGLVFPLGLFGLAFFEWGRVNEALLLGEIPPLANRFGSDARLGIWYQMLDAVARSPWFGYGWNQVSVAQQEVALSHPSSHIYLESSHNILIDIVLWVGVPTAIVIFCVFGVWLRSIIGASKNPKRLSVFLGVVVVLVHAFFEYPMNYAYFLLPAGLMAGTIFQEEIKNNETSVLGVLILWRKFFTVFSLVGAAGFLILIPEYFRWESTWSELQYQSAGIGNERTIALPSPTMLTGFLNLGEVVKNRPRRGMPAFEIDQAKKVSTRYGWGNLLFKYALIAGLNGMPADAIRALEMICKTNSREYCLKIEAEWRLWRDSFPELFEFDASEF